ncbi:hypothetical protein KXD93_11750 [Mucilaginibacter sp. BJC16-A38]|uniref:hypothetical protein n=1 Tax=Mucilaginibacter phenanthrenivorans TaxID=1234842 RepID=UPI002157817B|nr:hypothetical protein [Mucilaginibacter phenanthrenivorans]MCR8558325.1 hypothetical protein [Mucilaginibacter phenanthrenivorans]
MIKISQKLKDKLWWLIISVDYDYSRITIADHDLTADALTLWLEDKHDFKNTLDECLQVDIPVKQFARIIKEENLNSYFGSKMHESKNYVYKAQIEINPPLTWYRDDASLYEQRHVRETVLKHLLTQLIESQTIGDDMILY